MLGIDVQVGITQIQTVRFGRFLHHGHGLNIHGGTAFGFNGVFQNDFGHRQIGLVGFFAGNNFFHGFGHRLHLHFRTFGLRLGGFGRAGYGAVFLGQRVFGGCRRIGRGHGGRNKVGDQVSRTFFQFHFRHVIGIIKSFSFRQGFLGLLGRFNFGFLVDIGRFIFFGRYRKFRRGGALRKSFVQIRLGD